MSYTVRPLAFLSRAAVHAERALASVLVLLMGIMVIDVSWQVVSRFVFRAPSSFTEELAGFLLIWIGLLGAAYGVRTRAHLGIDLFVTRLPNATRAAATILAHLLMAGFALSVMLIGGTRLVQLALQLDQISAAMGIRMGFVYLALPIAGALIIVFSCEAITREVVARGRR